MRRKLSSSETFFFKFIAGPFVVGLLAVPTALVLVNDYGPTRSEFAPLLRYGILGAWIIVALIMWRYCRRLKAVWLDDDALYVSNFFREVHVPLTMVNDVWECRFDRHHSTTVTFCGDIGFGKRIIFIPLFRFWWTVLWQYRMADSIREAVAEAKQRASQLEGRQTTEDV